METQTKPAEMSEEIRSMVDLRHSAEQRGNFSPLGRLVSMITQHGTILWPSEQGEGCGPDLAMRANTEFEEGDIIDHSTFLVLGQWSGLPALRRNSTTPCPRCRQDCDVCDGSGKKQCEGMQCGGRGTVPDVGVECPAPGCAAETGKFNPACDKCGGSGWFVPMIVCLMCGGSGRMTCSRCRGTGKFSTGRVDGSLDYQLPRCISCDGTGWKGTLEKQDVGKFTNAELVVHRHPGQKSRVLQYWFALGPIQSFVVQDFQTSKPRQFEVSPDDKGDLLFLLVPSSPRQKPQKAYLVGGKVRESAGARGAA
jgi:hypothetical protein